MFFNLYSCIYLLCAGFSFMNDMQLPLSKICNPIQMKATIKEISKSRLSKIL